MASQARPYAPASDPQRVSTPSTGSNDMSRFTPLMQVNGNTPNNTNASARSSEEPAGRRRSTLVSRGVSNLTPEQLSRKRANDRLAQREARKRTKSRIEELEQRVQELEAQPLYQDLQEALRQKDAIQGENEELRRRLASIAFTIQPALTSSGAKPPLHSADSSNGHIRSQAPLSQHPEPRSPASHSDRSSHNPTSNHGPSDPPLRAPLSVESAATNYTGSPASVEPPSPTNPLQGLRPSWQSLPGPQGEQQEWNRSGAFDSQKRNLMNHLDFSGHGERLELNFLLDSSRQRVPKLNENRRSPSIPSSAGPRRRQPAQVVSPGSSYGDGNPAAYSIPVRNVDPTCPLDNILLDFLRTRQYEAAEGASKRQLVGPPYPSVSSLLNPAQSAFSHPLSKVFTDILSKFPDISSLPEQVAVLYIMFLLMRWQIYPTQENYERLPHWLTPRTSQIFTPHPAWMDYLPWPSMRDRMIPNHTDYEFSNWFIPYTTTISLNWPYEATDALLSSPDQEELMINPVFESHLRNLNNWSLGPAFAKAYPHLADTARIKQDGKDHPS